MAMTSIKMPQTRAVPARTAQPAFRVTARRVARPSVVARAQATAGKVVPRWEEVWSFLREKGLQTISPEEAAARVASGEWVLIDVRLPEAHKASHPAGAVSVPLYQPIDFSNLDAVKVLKTIMYKFNGVNPVEPNPRFEEQIAAAVAGGKGVITLCEAGGTMSPSTNFPCGKASRSLQAAYRVMNRQLAGRVAHLDRGAFGWYQASLAFEGDGEYKPELGRTPNAAAEPTLKSIQDGVAYDMRDGDKPAQQEEKKGWW